MTDVAKPHAPNVRVAPHPELPVHLNLESAIQSSNPAGGEVRRERYRSVEPRQSGAK
jgi:hypothetical protein